MLKTITLKSTITNDDYTDYVYSTFDIQDKQQTITKIPMDLDDLDKFEWSIGLIVGGSGSGKSTILNYLGGMREANFDENKPLISNFSWLSPEEASKVLMSIGLSSIPAWLRPYNLLSNGEQYRAKLAYLISSAAEDEIILIDEYTSFVDRDVAKAMSFALQKYIRKSGKKIILASCHSDIIEWLLPDWTCSPLKGGGIERADCLRQRPSIELQAHRVEYDTWDFFKKHHYLTEDVSKSCKFFLFTWNNKPVGINCVIPQPSGYFKKGVRESRIVVLPEYQGLGLGTIISEWTASIYKDSGYKYFTKTVHPGLGNYRNAHPEKWKPTSKNGIYQSDKNDNSMGNWAIKRRKSFCHEYIGNGVSGQERLLLPVSDLRKVCV